MRWTLPLLSSGGQTKDEKWAPKIDAWTETGTKRNPAAGRDVNKKENSTYSN